MCHKHVKAGATEASKVNKKPDKTPYLPQNVEPSSVRMTSMRQVICYIADSLSIMSIGNV